MIIVVWVVFGDLFLKVVFVNCVLYFFFNFFCFVYWLGLYEVKEYFFFMGLNWMVLLRQKVEFILVLDGEDDISYFDSKLYQRCNFVYNCM